MSTPTPDLAGFADAQNRLRQAIGVDAVFVHAGDKTFDPSVQLNPRTGQPYDPFTAPTSTTAEVRETVRCERFTPRLYRQGGANETPIGFMADADLILGFNLADLGRVQGADSVEVEGEVYKLRSTMQDTIGARGLAFVEHA